MHTKIRITVIELEPTPYKTDLWNAFSLSKKVELYVVFTEAKNWASDGGHNYKTFPVNRYTHVICNGRGVFQRLAAIWTAIRNVIFKQSDLIIIAGYNRPATFLSICFAILFNRRFMVHGDEYNNNLPAGKFRQLKYLIREVIRKVVFYRGDSVLVCGKRGLETALKAGASKHKVLNFPYVIDVSRMLNDSPNYIPKSCKTDINNKLLILFFSGRMILRKGLDTLLRSLGGLKHLDNWVLWVEGDGPELAKYQVLADELGLKTRIRFLGFAQFDLHSWLIRTSEIVIVPSLEDTWGIVVDEGLQLKKVVLTSDATGSGYDRVKNGENGMIFKAGNVNELKDCIELLISDESLRMAMKDATTTKTSHIGPRQNLDVILNRYQTWITS